ncbi:MAG: hypothetical protein J5529_04440 [Prevotella sp.]|nr:hypothetical protein [Prevotella sp.]
MQTAQLIQQSLAPFDKKIDGLIHLYLLSLSDAKGQVSLSVGRMATELGIHRKSLSVVLDHLKSNGFIQKEETQGELLSVITLTKKRPVRPAISIDVRRKAFIEGLDAHASQYPADMLQAFADYWTEPNRSNTRMRWELQPTWNLSMRLATWARKAMSFARSMCSQHRTTSAEYVAQAQQWAEAETLRIIREAEQERKNTRSLIHQ